MLHLAGLEGELRDGVAEPLQQGKRHGATNSAMQPDTPAAALEEPIRAVKQEGAGGSRAVDPIDLGSGEALDRGTMLPTIG